MIPEHFVADRNAKKNGLHLHHESVPVQQQQGQKFSRESGWSVGLDDFWDPRQEPKESLAPINLESDPAWLEVAGTRLDERRSSGVQAVSGKSVSERIFSQLG